MNGNQQQSQHFTGKQAKNAEEFWDAQATLPGYSGIVVDDENGTATKMLYNFLSTQLDFRDKIILDIGCGPGRLFSIYQSFSSFEIHGVDISANMIRLARFKFPQPNVFLYKQDASNLYGITDNRFDVTICQTLLGHIIEDEYAVKAIEEIIRVTKTGGIIYICEPTSINLNTIYQHSRLHMRPRNFYIHYFIKDNNVNMVMNEQVIFGAYNHPDSIKTVMVFEKR